MAANGTSAADDRIALITGGCGFLGRHVTRHLMLGGVRRIAIVDDLSVGRHPDRWLPAEQARRSSPTTCEYESESGTAVCFHHADVREALADLRWVPWGADFGDVFHLAARVGGRLALEGHPLTIADNLSIDAAFFRWLVDHAGNVGRALYLSSSAVYPMDYQRFATATPLAEPMTRSAPAAASDGIYGWAKLTGELLAQTTSRAHGIPIACVRPFSVYGPGQDLTYPMSAIGRRVMGHEDPLTIWGAGDQQRDFLYISDAIDGFMLALDKTDDARPINLGSGIGRSFRDVASTMAQVVGYEPLIAVDESKPTGAEVRVADTSLMEQVLDWQPAVDFEDGVRELLTALTDDDPLGLPA